MLKRAGILIVAALLGTGAAAAAGGCGDERGSVTFEGDTGGTATGSTATETATETAPRTAPETESTESTTTEP